MRSAIDYQSLYMKAYMLNDSFCSVGNAASEIDRFSTRCYAEMLEIVNQITGIWKERDLLVWDKGSTNHSLTIGIIKLRPSSILFSNYPIDAGAFLLHLPNIATAQQDKNPVISGYLLNNPAVCCNPWTCAREPHVSYMLHPIPILADF